MPLRSSEAGGATASGSEGCVHPAVLGGVDPRRDGHPPSPAPGSTSPVSVAKRLPTTATQRLFTCEGRWAQEGKKPDFLFWNVNSVALGRSPSLCKMHAFQPRGLRRQSGAKPVAPVGWGASGPLPGEVLGAPSSSTERGTGTRRTCSRPLWEESPCLSEEQEALPPSPAAECLPGASPRVLHPGLTPQE